MRATIIVESQKIIVTAGEPYTDIDGYACVLAYRGLLRLRGMDAEAVLPGPLNASVPLSLRSMGGDFLTAPTEPSGVFVVVDISQPDYIAKFVDQSRIVELYDHHFKFEDYWHARLGEKAKIVPVGACATLVWEEYKNHGFEQSISENNANLLVAAIVSNTLNFRSSMTHERDRVAFADLQSHISMPATWVVDYFKESEAEIFHDVSGSLATDIKVVDAPDLGLTLVIGQIELCDGNMFIEKYKEIIKKVLSGFGKEHWFMSVPSISENKNYFYTEDPISKKLLINAINAEFNGDVGTTNKLWMRKEILRDLKPVS